MPTFSIPIDRVNWSTVHHAYGPAVEMPLLLENLWSANPSIRGGAYEGLREFLVDAGARWPASIAAVPYLMEIVANENAFDRVAAYRLLLQIAVGDEEAWLAAGPDIARLRAEVDRKSGMTTDELQKDALQWAANASTAMERESRQRRIGHAVFELDRDIERWSLESYDAVRSGVPVFLRTLNDPLSTVRLNSAFLLSWFPEDHGMIAPSLVRAIIRDPDSRVVSTSCVAAGMACRESEPELVGVLADRRQSASLIERWSAVLGLGWLLDKPDRSVVRDLYDCLLSAPRQAASEWPFLDGSISAMAHFVIRTLHPEVRTERLEAVLERIVDRVSTDDAFWLVRASLEAAFLDGPLPDDFDPGSLDDGQRQVLAALRQRGFVGRDREIDLLFQRLNIPLSALGVRLRR